jgi:hypothetical protein
MMLAADYPFLDVLFSMLVFVVWLIWLWILVVVLSDVFRRRDISGWAKAGWTVFAIVLPFLGVLTYMIAHSEGLADRREGDVHAQLNARDRAPGAEVRGGGAVEQIASAKRLLDAGTIDQAEFEQLKRKALA